MANICVTEYIFMGSYESLTDFRNTIVNAMNNRTNDTFPRPFSILDTVKSFGISTEGLAYRGEIVSIDEVRLDIFRGEEIPILYIDTTTAWVPFPEAWDLIINERYPDMSYVMCAEEPGFQLYVNTDTSHDFFDVAYRVTITMAPKYYTASFNIGVDEPLLNSLNCIFGWRCKCIKQFNKKLKRKKARMRKLRKPFYFYLNEYVDTF